MSSEIHGGKWRTTTQAFGGTEHDAAITVMSDDGIVATAATVHCGRVRAEEIAEVIAAAPEMASALAKTRLGKEFSESAIQGNASDDLPVTIIVTLGDVRRARAIAAKLEG